jgi:hypothetical protein
MSEHDPHPPAGETGEESFLGRWSRLKAQSRELEASQAVAPEESDGDAAPAVVDEPSADVPPPAVELPDLDLLDQDSDYSAFLTPGVDSALRKRALRKLFSSPKFNVFDGLDTYRDDFTSFPPLGEVVTADMRHHLERIAKEIAARTEEDAAAAAPPAAEASAEPVADSQERPAALPPARTDEDVDTGPA